MRFLPAVAAVVAATVAVVSFVRNDWGVLIVSGLLCVVALSATLLGRRNEPPAQRSPDPH